MVGSGLALEHTKLVVNGGSMLRIDSGGWIIARHCLLDGMGLDVATDLAATPFEIAGSGGRGGRGQSLIEFHQVESPVLRPGQIVDNDLDGFGFTTLEDVTGTAAIPLGNNYWSEPFFEAPFAEPPSVISTDSTAAIDYSVPGEPLREAPAGAGPDW